MKKEEEKILNQQSWNFDNFGRERDRSPEIGKG